MKTNTLKELPKEVEQRFRAESLDWMKKNIVEITVPKGSSLVREIIEIVGELYIQKQSEMYFTVERHKQSQAELVAEYTDELQKMDLQIEQLKRQIK